MDKNTNTTSRKLIQFVSSLVEKLSKASLRDQQVICMMACTVATYNSVAGTATLYIPPDIIRASTVNYVNRTGATLTVGQKVYILYKFGDISQGWIAHK